MESIRVFVVDDHPMIRHGLAAMLRAESGITWVGEAADAAEAIRTAPALAPDVVLTSLLDPTEARRAMAAGASGFLLKNASSQELITVIRTTVRGQRVLAPEVTDALMATARNSTGADLTQRERELLGLMARGLSNQEISKRLSIAMPTVKFHVTNILAKLHADNRTEAVLVALKNKLVALE